jgi:hypothetical protein
MQGIEGAGRGLGNSFELPAADFQVSVDEALLLSNSDRLANDLVRDSKDKLVGRLADCSDHRAAAELAVKTILCRPPAEDELAALTDYLAKREDRLPEARRQLVWALLTSSECRFNY